MPTETENQYAELDKKIEMAFESSFESNLNALKFYRNVALSLAGYVIQDFNSSVSDSDINLAKNIILGLVNFEKGIAS